MSLYDQTEDPSYDEQEEQAFEDELDSRLALVGYFRQLYGGVFNDGTQEGATVDQEIAKWARDQVKVCAGHSPAAAQAALFSPEEVTALKKLIPLVDQLQGVLGQLRTKVQVAPPTPTTPVAPKVSAPKVAPKAAPAPTNRINPGLKPSGKPAAKPTKPKGPKPKGGAVFPKGHKVLTKEETDMISANTAARIAGMKNNSNALSQGAQDFVKYGGNKMPAQLIDDKHAESTEEPNDE